MEVERCCNFRVVAPIVAASSTVQPVGARACKGHGAGEVESRELAGGRGHEFVRVSCLSARPHAAWGDEGGV